MAEGVGQVRDMRGPAEGEGRQGGRPVWRLLRTGAASGAWNMAVDEAILHSVAAGMAPPTLRLYRWQPPCLSLGYFQRQEEEADLAAAAARGVDVVRRPTGGRAVLHHHEVTYSVALRETTPGLPPSVAGAYRFLCRGLVAGLAALGLRAEVAPGPGRTSGSAGAAGRGWSAACFDAPSWYELSVGGRKVVGSAQVRRGGGVLQHGAVVLRFDAEALCSVLRYPSGAAREAARRLLADRAAGLSDVAGRDLSPGEVEEALCRGFEAALGIQLRPGELLPAEQRQAERLWRERQMIGGWHGPGRAAAREEAGG